MPGHLEPSAATLAILGDYVTGGMAQPIGRRVFSRSLDNTLRVVRLEPTEWVLCDIRIQALAGGYGQGTAFLWSESGQSAGHGQPVDERPVRPTAAADVRRPRVGRVRGRRTRAVTVAPTVTLVEV